MDVVMSKIIPSIAVLVFAFIGGCGPTLQMPKPIITDTDFPKIGEVIEAEVGDRLIHESFQAEYPAIEAVNDAQCKNALGAGPKIEQGQSFKKRKLGNNDVFCGITSLYMVGGSKGGTAQICFHKNSTNSFDLGGYKCSGLEFIETTVIDDHPENFQRTILYNGVSGNQIFLSYREFKNRFARAAFTQELTFDLSQGNEIGFRGVRIKVLSATNTTIKYELLSKFRERL